jgi:hypothetical protein
MKKKGSNCQTKKTKIWLDRINGDYDLDLNSS